MFLRVDMPGHLKHKQGGTRSRRLPELSGRPEGRRLPASEFFQDFAPDEKFHYARESHPVPQRSSAPRTGCAIPRPAARGPWLAGMTLDPAVVYEAWCHQRGYVCMIEEFGGRPVPAGGSFSARPSSSLL